jgi:lysozyme family protein
VNDNFSLFLSNILRPDNDGQGPHVTAGDPGGDTSNGVTLPTLAAYLGRPATPDDLAALTPPMIEDLYRHLFWNKVQGDDLPIGVDLVVADYAVVDGPEWAIKTLQRACGAVVDGDLGRKTLAAVRAADPMILILAIVLCQVAHDVTLSDAVEFEHGWENRIGRNAVIAIKQTLNVSLT